MKQAICILLVLFSFNSFAEDIVISTRKISCIGKDDNGIYKYRVGLVLKNIGKEEITLMSKSQGGSVHLDENGTPVVLIGNTSELQIDEVLIVPDASELSLVTLKPSEGAQIHETYKSRRSLGEKAKVGYHATSVYGGRFNSWQGVVTSGVESIAKSEACEP